MRQLTATEAARSFSDLLDRVEHDGETFLVERRGRVIASVGPVSGATGRAVKDLLRAQPADDQWATDLASQRAGLKPEDRRWTD